MDIPLAYIIFDIMISLKKNNRDTMIYRDILIIYLKRFINSFDLDKDVLEDLIFDFNFANELSFFLDDYEDYFEMEDGIIRLNSDVSINELKKLQEENVILEDFDEEFISDVEKVIHNDISFLEIIGINPNIQVYNALLELEEELEYKYLDLSYDGLFDENTIEKTREEIKLLKVITNIMYININNNFSSVDYDNLYLYAKDRAKLMHGEESEVKLSRNPPFDKILLVKTPMDKALFINDSSAKGAIKGRLKMNNKKNKKKINMQDMTKLNFYLMYLELLDKEINKTKNIELKDELIIAKYRLMYVLDSIYDLMNFKKRESSVKINGDYSFIETIIYFFTVEVLSYDDKEYKLDGTNKKDIITYYFNIIKKLYVETYYKLTNDRAIIDLINNSNFYNVNTISSKLFSNIVPSEKNKSKIKKKNF